MDRYQYQDALVRLRQEYAEGELDQDRNPTEDGFVEWMARSLLQARAEAVAGPGDAAECPHLADVLAGRSDRAHSDSSCAWCADIRTRSSREGGDRRG